MCLEGQVQAPGGLPVSSLTPIQRLVFLKRHLSVPLPLKPSSVSPLASGESPSSTLWLRRSFLTALSPCHPASSAMGSASGRTDQANRPCASCSIASCPCASLLRVPCLPYWNHRLSVGLFLRLLSSPWACAPRMAGLCLLSLYPQRSRYA